MTKDGFGGGGRRPLLGAAGVLLAAAAAALAFHGPRWRRRRRVPITILSGFLGAGKTTLLAHLLGRADGRRIAVLVNDLAEVNVDARVLQTKAQGASSMVAFGQLENGCLCCTAEADLAGAVAALLGAGGGGGRVDHVVIECSGMAQPSSLLELFAKAEEEGHSVTEYAVLNRMVTVVDARTLLTWLGVASGTTRASVGDDAGVLSALLVEQIECADVVILSKVDCLLQTQLAKCRAAVRALNPNALLECASFGDVAPTVILGSPTEGGRSRSQRRPPRQGPTVVDHHDHHGHCDHCDQADDAAAPHVRSFVYASRRPFHPMRLVGLLRSLRSQFLAGPPGLRPAGGLGTGLLRSKGLVWLATDADNAREWAQVGGTLHIHGGDPWKQEWTASGMEPYGDRRQEIVFIGTGEMQEHLIRDALDACLLTADEMGGGPDAWRALPDPVAITPTGPRHKRPTTHGVGCTCCDPELKAIDQMVSRQIQ